MGGCVVVVSSFSIFCSYASLEFLVVVVALDDMRCAREVGTQWLLEVNICVRMETLTIE